MDRKSQIIKTSIIGIVVNIILVIFKAVVGIITGSIAIIMDAVNNLSDALSSIITIIGTIIANKAPNKKYPYGYGRIEYVSSISIAVIVLLAGITSFLESFKAIINPVKAEYSFVSMGLIVIAVVVKVMLGKYFVAQGNQYNSESLVGSGKDAIFDSILSISTLVAAIVNMMFGLSIEGYLGAIISIVIVKAGVEILMQSIGSIIGNRIDSELTNKLKHTIKAHSMVKGVYDLVLHQYGPEKFIGSVHIEVEDHLVAKDIHKLTRELSTEVYMNYGIVITIGIYASNLDSEECIRIKNDLKRIIKVYSGVLELHGFYVDQEAKTVSFDLMVDYKIENAADIRNEIATKIKEKYPEYEYYVVLDHDFSGE